MVKDNTKIDYRDVAKMIEDDAYKEHMVITKDGKDIMALVSLEDLDLLDEIKIEMKKMDEMGRNVQVKMMNMSGESLTYDEMEYLRDQIIKAFDSMFKPDTEKMN